MTAVGVPSAPARLREQKDDLSVLVDQTATYLGIDPAFVEKDFWVTEVLRAVADGVPITLKDGTENRVAAVFKGGTSLSRVFELIERFSEDVDLLVIFPDGASLKARDRALKALADNARTHLGFDATACRSEGATTGVKRNYRYLYPRAFPSPAAEDGVLLEMGSRGGDQPHAPHTMRSMVATYAQDVLGETVDTWEEWTPVTVDVLAPERTLLEKLAALHDLATRSASDTDATLKLARSARHYYDIHKLLADDGVRAALTGLGPAGVAALAADVDKHSADAGWDFTPRPADGYATSVAFDAAGPHAAEVLVAYGKAMDMVHGDKPSWQQCLATVAEHADLL